MVDSESLLELTEAYLKTLVAGAATSLSADFDSNAPFGELGIDSFRVLKIIKSLEMDFGTLPKTLLFENFDVASLARYFVSKHEPSLQAKFARPAAEVPATVAVTARAPRPARVPPTARAAHSTQRPVQPEPLSLLEQDLASHPALQAQVHELFAQYKSEGCVSRGTRNIAPNLFMGSERHGFFHYGRSKNIILVYAYTGPADYFPALAREMYAYCAARQLQLNIFADQALGSIAGVPFSATPFGVLQRVANLKDFTLEGGEMRRLRYQVTKFGKAGACRTREYRCGTDPAVDHAIAGVIDQWCATKPMVNPLVRRVREEILAGRLDSQHRLFLTYVDDTLHNVILLSELCTALNGYLMDLEFYTQDMPLGGLEFAIVRIIETLVAEGRDLLSLGGTYGCRLTSSPCESTDSGIERILDDLHKQNIFNDSGNLQFKNKFRPDNRTVYLCREVGSGEADNVIDIIMMIADPDKAQTSDAENHNAGVEACDRAVREGTPSGAANPAVGARLRALADCGFNPLNLDPQHVELDLKTDSWAQLRSTAIDTRMAALRAQLQLPVSVTDSLKAVFPFNYFLLADSGRSAERLLCKAWPRKGVVPQNLLFPSGIYHQIDQGFTPREMPDPEVFRLDSDAPYKGNLSLQALREELAQHPAEIAFVCVEVSDNAAGGAPVCLRHLRELKQLLATHSLPLVMDATRILENAYYLGEHESEHAGKTLWSVAREILSCADVVVASLAKDFAIDKGGLIATHDERLASRLQELAQREGGGLDVIDRKLVALALTQRKPIETLVARRVQAVRSIFEALEAHHIPLSGPAGGHCVLIDVKQIQELRGFAQPVATFLAWLYLNTGIRAGAHSVGMQKGTALNGLVRLAIPIGLEPDQVKDIIARLTTFFASRHDIPELVADGHAVGAFPDPHARYQLARIHRQSGAAVAADRDDTVAAVPDGATVVAAAQPTPTAPVAVESGPARHAHRGPIAVVGMAGRYPQASSLEEFWQSLRAGKDCVGDMPPQRLARRAQYGFTRGYRGGFLENVDKFDSLFFNISPREAEVLDPQERLFLEVAWEALEDAGYYPEALAPEGSPRRVGVFVGAVWAMYQILGLEEKLAGNAVNPNSFLWSIANRVSYWMNLSGPSLTIDTACSSSLTALYLACEALHNGDCSSALVGGVNLDLHQTKFDINWAGGALSGDGLCRSFGAGANGYVAGEGVGALLIKPLAAALADQDQIYGVIRSAVVNHGGRTSGYTVPNPRAHAELVTAALEKSGVDARSIGYIEAHGTGTELGDPIEISGLTSAFESYRVTPQSCAIGSVKTNIGHLEAAAGIVGVSKVLLQMKHRQLVPSLHAAQLNEHIDFSSSPFYVQQKLEEWQPREIEGVRLPLRAGISSFGAGGANAHVIVEEYPRAAVDASVIVGGHLVPLSARSEEQLREMASRLRAYLQSAALRPELSDIAFTLQNGRKSFEHRLAIVAASREELIARLGLFVEGVSDRDVLRGNAQNSHSISRLLSRKEREQLLDLLLQTRDLHRVGQLWVDGLLTEARGLLQGAGRRVSLPTYPFADKRHWIATSRPTALRSTSPHPLIDSNESTFQRQLFKKSFAECEFFIRDHVVAQVPTLPGVAYLELARKAGEIAAGRRVRKIRNVTWVSPLTVSAAAPTEAFIELKPNADVVHFEVFSQGLSGKRLHAQGKLLYETAQQAAAQPEYCDLDRIRARCTTTLAGKDAYPLFHSLGLEYGPSFQVLQQVCGGDGEFLGLLKLPEVREADFGDFVLHPSLLDASMQAGVAGQLGAANGEMKVPYSIGEVELLHPLTRTCYSHVTRANVDKGATGAVSRENVTILDETGKVLARLRECVGVPLASVHAKPLAAPGEDADFATLYYSHVWDESAAAGPARDPEHVLLFDLDERLRDACVARKVSVTLVLPGQQFEDLGQHTYRVNPQDPADYTRLMTSLGRSRRLPDKVCYAWPQCSVPDSESELRAALDRGVYAFLLLCQSLIEQRATSLMQLLYLYSRRTDAPQPHNEAISGFARALHLEHPKVDCKVVELPQDETDLQDVLAVVLSELRVDVAETATIRYDQHIRRVRRLEKLELEGSNEPAIAPKPGGVYLITGGAGGLGLIFAEFLARQYQARLILTGRSAPTRELTTRLDGLRSLGAEVLYIAADVSRSDHVARALAQSRAHFGRIDGIIHSAGVLQDSYLRKKTSAQMQAVLAPKVFGTVHLDEQTRGDRLDFFVLFSSLAALGGNAGQCDYAFANHFMDSFAAQREVLRHSGRRAGKTLSLNWSLWADGGMKLDAPTEQFFRKSLGIRPLRTEVGLAGFLHGLRSDRTHLAVLEGIQVKVEQAWGLARKDAATVQVDSNNGLSGPVMRELSQAASALLKLDVAELSPDAILVDLGFDSIGLATFANAINDKYRLDINPVLFFEYPTLRAVATVLATEHGAAVQKVHGGTGAPDSAVKVTAVTHEAPLPIALAKGFDSPAESGDTWRQQRFTREPIAIVGIAGTLPQSANLEEFWDHLSHARDLVTEIPRDRWNWEDHDGNPVKESNKSYSRWGGFMKEVDKFDTFFFGITPREAEMMDPQQRIFLQTVWHAIEDSGHKVSDLSGTRTGLFVGVSAKDYIDVLTGNEMAVDGYSASGNSHSILANRVSFLLNLRGPSAPLDTACSSSLVALHRAIESIHTGSSDMAIVGGVQVMLTPVGHISLSSAGMLSMDGKCKTFDKDANGYVRGEGSGAILIKPLARAEADGNPIYAIIKATAENHGGRVTLLTAPNPNAQAELLIEAYEKAEIDPSTVGYIECHGTGTSLGDPIEIQALKKSFAELYKRRQRTPAHVPHCGLSAVKTNIGHLEPAAGIAGLLKVLLAIKHRQIPPLLHFSQLNPYIDLKGSPFYIVDKLTPWEASQDQDGRPLPRRAGVSSFGWGGANAHVVLEEYLPPQPAAALTMTGPQLVVLSAKRPDRLEDYVESILTHVAKYPVPLADLAFTLQVGRDALEERLAVVADSPEELTQKLRAWLVDASTVAGVYRGRTSPNKRNAAEVTTNTAEGGTVTEWLAAGNLARLASAWVMGADVDWTHLRSPDEPDQPGQPRRRVSLPGYPFARERYWVDTAAARRKPKPVASVSAAAPVEEGSLMAHPHWEPTSLEVPVSQPPVYERHDIILCDLAHVRPQKLQALVSSAAVTQLPLGELQGTAARYTSAALTCFERVQALLKSRPKGTVLLQIVVADGPEDALLAGLHGLIRSARLENRHFKGQVILSGAAAEEALAQQLNSARRRPDEVLLRFTQGAPSVLRWQIEARQSSDFVGFRERGRYLITGGLGGLGLLFARDILSHVKSASIAFTGRTPLDADKAHTLDRLAEQAGIRREQLIYRALDLNDLAQVEAVVADITTELGGLHGVIHSAGMNRDALILNKTAAEFADVLAPKVTGTVNLDHATRDLELDFLVLFSSVSTVTGNGGHADYATANGFMDQFAAYRNQLSAAGLRRGHAVSINWPLWDEGGMRLDPKARVLLAKASGMQPMRTQTGLQAFHRSLELPAAQVLVMEGDLQRLRQLVRDGRPVSERPQVRLVVNHSSEQLRELVLADLRGFQTRRN